MTVYADDGPMCDCIADEGEWCRWCDPDAYEEARAEAMYEPDDDTSWVDDI
jgi:hypothetical protein